MNRRAFFTGAASVAIATAFTGPKPVSGSLTHSTSSALVGMEGFDYTPLQQMEASRDLITTIAEFKEQILNAYYIPNRLVVPRKLMPALEKIGAHDLVQVFDWEPIDVSKKEIWRGIDD